MLYRLPKFTVPTSPEIITCCEACVYGRGEHAHWCWECKDCGQRMQVDAFRTHACQPTYFDVETRTCWHVDDAPLTITYEEQHSEQAEEWRQQYEHAIAAVLRPGDLGRALDECQELREINTQRVKLS